MDRNIVVFRSPLEAIILLPDTKVLCLLNCRENGVLTAAAFEMDERNNMLVNISIA